MRLTEKYRPTTLQGVVGQDKAVATIERLSDSIGGRAFWITGKSGTGKTTLARIIAGQMADRWTTTETVGRQLTVNGLRNMSQSWHLIPLGDKPGYALIVNEAHGLSKPVIEVLLDLIESLKDNVAVIFTTTNDGNDLFEEHIDAGPFASRCISIKLTSQGLAPKFAERLREIAQGEGLDGKPTSEYVKLVNACRGNSFSNFAR